MNAVCVFCGSMSGTSPEFEKAADRLGKALATRNINVVYGGGRVGIMGRLADSTLAAGGRVTGVIPEAMVDLELANHDVTKLHVVGSMHERKALMHDLSDAFIALPGGFGTLDELFEALTWSQLGIHEKPCGLLNVHGYFDSLLEFLDQAESKGFIPPRHRAMLMHAASSDDLLDLFDEFLKKSD